MVLSILLSLMAGLATNVKDYTFTHLGIEDGVAGPHIFNICQTADGVVWWSTKNTVDRYNGRSVKNYFLGADAPYSHFSGRTVGLALSSDGKNDLYAFDNKGYIFRYDKVLDQFVLIADVSVLMDGKVVILNHVYVDKYGIWLSLDCGIYCISGGKISSVLDNRFAHYIIECEGEHLLCTDGGVFRIGSPDKQAQFFYPCKATTAYYDAAKKSIWLGTFSSGVKVVSKDALLISEVENIPLNPVRCIVPDDEDSVLVGVDGFGVYSVPSGVANPKASLMIHANEGDKGVLHGNGVYSLLKDSWGNLFIGTYSGGVDIARPTAGIAKVIRYTSGKAGSVNNNHVNCVAQVPGFGVVIGTDAGVSIFSDGKWSKYADDMVVLDVIKDGDNLLLASFGEGIYKLTPDGKASRLYSVKGGQLEGDYVYSLYRSKDGHLWMGSLAGGVVERTENGFRTYPVSNVQDIAQLPDGRMAIGTASGIVLINPGSYALETFSFASPAQDVNNFVMNLLVDGDNLWIGSDGGGVYVVNLSNVEDYRQITKKEGLPGNGITSILKGNDGVFWVCTENGLCSIDKNWTVTPQNHIWELNREYSRGASTIMQDGKLLLGSTDGAVILDTEKIENVAYNAPVRLIGADFKARSEKEYLEKMTVLLGDEPELNLRYRENTFELFFESVNLRYQQDIAYQYCMDDGEWSRPSAEGHFRFTEVKAGSHILHVRSVSSDAGTLLDEMSLNVSVAQPLWNTWWMWTIYVLLIVGIFIGGWKIYQLHTRYMHLVLSNPALIRDDQESDEGPKDGNGKEFVDSVTRVVMAHLSESGFSVDDLCREMGMSRTYLYVRLKAFTGESPQTFMRIIRMEKAAIMLRSGINVSDVADAVGFENHKYFSTVFKKYFEISPSKYR